MKFIYAVFLDRGLIGVFSSARKAERFRKAQAKQVGERIVVVRLGLNEKLEERLSAKRSSPVPRNAFSR